LVVIINYTLPVEVVGAYVVEVGTLVLVVGAIVLVVVTSKTCTKPFEINHDLINYLKCIVNVNYIFL
jgi:hypothetical protein